MSQHGVTVTHKAPFIRHLYHPIQVRPLTKIDLVGSVEHSEVLGKNDYARDQRGPRENLLSKVDQNNGTEMRTVKYTKVC